VCLTSCLLNGLSLLEGGTVLVDNGIFDGVVSMFASNGDMTRSEFVNRKVVLVGVTDVASDSTWRLRMLAESACCFEVSAAVATFEATIDVRLRVQVIPKSAQFLERFANID